MEVVASIMKAQSFTLIVSNANEAVGEIANTLRLLGYQTDKMEFLCWKKNLKQNSILILDARKENEFSDEFKLISKQFFPCFAIIINSDEASLGNVFDFFQDFVLWPCGPQELAQRLEHVISAAKKNRSCNENIQHKMIGNTPVFKMLLNKIARIAMCDAPVLIEGETGTGKELGARAIHYQSQRSDKPFIPVNCGALPDSLLENELFGHEKGAYTDAGNVHEGLVAQAEGGTLFLDEIDALSMKAQVALLRFLQEKEYRPLGSKVARKSDIRFIAACNRRLESLVKNGEFRSDLFFRLNIIPVYIPSLKERHGDIRVLADFYVEKYQHMYKEFDKYLSSTSIARLENYDWPGNIRELDSVIHREFLLSVNKEISIPVLNSESDKSANYLTNEELDTAVGFHHAKLYMVNEFEKQYLHKLMQECNGNVSLAAKHAGKERRALGKLLKKHGINKQVYL